MAGADVAASAKSCLSLIVKQSVNRRHAHATRRGRSARGQRAGRNALCYDGSDWNRGPAAALRQQQFATGRRAKKIEEDVR
jgi:hypothetical protein